MILAPEFEGLGDDPVKRSRFRLYRWSTHMRAFSQTPPDLVVKFQHLEIISVIVAWVLRPHIVYQREIKG
jgi:hypothetical protein